MADPHAVKSLLSRFSRLVKEGSRGEIGAVCPFCGGSRSNPNKIQFFFNLNTEKYNCFRCGVKGVGLLSLGRKLGLSLVEIAPYLGGDPLSILKEHDRRLEGYEKKRFKPKKIWNEELERFCVKEHPMIDKFIDERLLGKNILNYPLYYGIKGDGLFWNRIIIPVFDGNDCVFFAGRAMAGQEPKYLMPSVDFDETLPIMGKDFGTTVFIVEGPVDVLIGGPSFTCSFGVINQTKLNWIKSHLGERDYILIPDRDPNDGQAGLRSVVNLEGRYKVFVPPVPKDLGDLLREVKEFRDAYMKEDVGAYIKNRTVSLDFLKMTYKLYS